ncbi:hypothetical protein [Mangrovicoccus sp. HB161399]|uniref:hypothetical protein n=1 Tax=Mangrovicoccus sp. HB161399 TaxID=2720392 RepID=UPI0015548B1B|nr:hypothetical protein [Mangrovicoccus sp. HB161399]
MTSLQIVRNPRLRRALAAACIIALPAAPVLAQDEGCAIPPDWISQGIPDPTILAKGDFTKSFCQFHTWAWNAFLWSMEEVDGALRFEGFPTQDQTIGGSYSGAGAPGTPVLKLRVGKEDHAIDSIAQAGTDGFLVAQNHRAIYFSQYVNPQMYDEILAKDWNTAAGLEAATSADPSPLFTIGDIEYKAAWAVVDDGFSVPGAYVRKAQIPLLATFEHVGKQVIGVPPDPTYAEAQVALVALHVVGWVNGHAEAIWASFSPSGLAPVVPQDGSVKPGDPVSAGSTPFYAGGTTLADCNQAQIPVQKLDAATQKLALATQVCQIYAQGSLEAGSPPAPDDNAEAILQINASAAATLPSDNPAKGYEEVGAVWSVKDDASDPSKGKVNTTFQDALIGSTLLSNPVVETFTQTSASQDNCFSCHNTIQYQPSDPAITPLDPSILNLSHFLMQIYEKTFTAAK